MQDRVYSIICPSCGTVHNGPVGYMSPHQGYYYCQGCTATVNINPETGEVIPYDVWANPNYNSKVNYPGLYELEDKTPKFSPDLLIKAMFKPKEAFVKLYHISNMKIGIALLILFAILSSTISFLAYQISGLDNIIIGMGSELPISWVTLAVITLPLGILSSLVASWLSAKISEYFKGRNDVKKTIALMGYAGMPGFIMGIVSSIVIATNLVSMPDYSDPMNFDLNALLAYAAIMGVIGLITLIWGL
ncbi:MAG: YIP1 family protein, partial [Thermoplasmata archaeon]|nr:YIP1 family protein [Thermoplasmata archaeon]